MISALHFFDYALFEHMFALTHTGAAARVAIFCNTAFVGLLILLIAYYAYHHRRAWRERLVVIALAGALAYLVSRIIGFLYFRPRPFVAHGFVPLINESPLSKSFPSSHSMVAFALAYALYCYDKKLGRIAFVIAACVALARVFVGVHYPSDIVAGAIFGVIVSWFTVKIVWPKLR